LGDVQREARRVVDNVRRALVGIDAAVELLLVALLADGHVLLEEVPGTGKTTLAKAMARSLGLGFARIQFTPDLLPGDITGVYWFNQRAGDFEFRPGPIFTNILLADEVNRATPRTQSALLEAMQERQVTVEGTTHALPDPFLVIATQNPVELEGTFPLPEAQIDRFLMRLRLGYPSLEDEAEMVVLHAAHDALDDVEAVVAPVDVPGLRQAVRGVLVSRDVRGYALQLVRTTREHPGLDLGASPRASLYLHRAAQARAAMQGRDYALPDDVKVVARPVLAHRLIMATHERLRGQSGDSVVEELLHALPVPVEG
jgi:MoxR-like ATPase